MNEELQKMIEKREKLDRAIKDAKALEEAEELTRTIADYEGKYFIDIYNTYYKVIDIKNGKSIVADLITTDFNTYWSFEGKVPIATRWIDKEISKEVYDEAFDYVKKLSK